ncbi:MAG: hypothetical protein JOZ73_12665 [Solirubrobacterales bacterium]|nr:hypothetical protein [Solirubrobacterales bacterium]
MPCPRGACSNGRTGHDWIGGHKLKPGTYTLILTPSANNQTGAAQQVTFRVTK